MSNAAIVLITAGIISVCFLIQKNRTDVEYSKETRLKNDTINILTQQLDSHKALINDIIAMADTECLKEVELIRGHFSREVKLK